METENSSCVFIHSLIREFSCFFTVINLWVVCFLWMWKFLLLHYVLCITIVAKMFSFTYEEFGYFFSQASSYVEFCLFCESWTVELLHCVFSFTAFEFLAPRGSRVSLFQHEPVYMSLQKTSLLTCRYKAWYFTVNLQEGSKCYRTMYNTSDRKILWDKLNLYESYNIQYDIKIWYYRLVIKIRH